MKLLDRPRTPPKGFAVGAVVGSHTNGKGVSATTATTTATTTASAAPLRAGQGISVSAAARIRRSILRGLAESASKHAVQVQKCEPSGSGAAAAQPPAAGSSWATAGAAPPLRYVPHDFYLVPRSCEWCAKPEDCPARGLPPTLCQPHIHSLSRGGAAVCRQGGCGMTHLPQHELAGMLAAAATVKAVAQAAAAAGAAGEQEATPTAEESACYELMARLGASGTGLLIEALQKDQPSFAGPRAVAYVERVISKYQPGVAVSLAKLDPCVYYMLGICMDHQPEGGAGGGGGAGWVCSRGGSHSVPRHLMPVCPEGGQMGCSRPDDCPFVHTCSGKKICGNFLRASCPGRLLCGSQHVYSTWL